MQKDYLNVSIALTKVRLAEYTTERRGEREVMLFCRLSCGSNSVKSYTRTNLITSPCKNKEKAFAATAKPFSYGFYFRFYNNMGGYRTKSFLYVCFI